MIVVVSRGDSGEKMSAAPHSGLVLLCFLVITLSFSSDFKAHKRQC